MKNNYFYIGIAYLLISLYPIGSGFIVAYYFKEESASLGRTINVFLDLGYWSIWILINSVIGVFIGVRLITLFGRKIQYYILVMAVALLIFNCISTLMLSDIYLLIRSGRVEPYITIFHGVLLYFLVRYKNLEFNSQVQR